jgi:hypothetical protein
MNNDMAGSQISNVLTKGFRNTVYDLGANLSNKIDIDLTKGDVQTGTVTGDVTLSFSKWSPSGTRSSVELILTVVPGQTITLPTNVIYGTESIVGVITDASGTSSIKIGNINRIHFVFSSIDCGDSIEIITTDRPKITNNVRFGAPLSAEGDIGDLKGDITFTETYMFLCVKDYTDGVDPIWSRSPLNGTTSW